MKKLVALLAATLSGALTLTAATPVAVWDGDFTATQTGFTLNRSGNAISQDNSTITIDQSVGVKVDSTTGFSSAMTVMFKYSDLAFNAQKTIATSFCSGGDENRTGVYLASGGTANGIWNTGDWAHPASTAFSASSGVLAFSYHKSNGTGLYYIDSAGVRTEIFFNSGLKASGDAAINGCTIGGERTKTGATLLSAATGMKITGIAIFNYGLSDAEMTGYIWPSEAQVFNVTVSENKTWSEVLSAAGVTESNKETAKLVITAEGNPKITFDVADSILYGLTVNGSAVFSAGDAVYGSGKQSFGKTLLSTAIDPSLPNVTFEVKDGWKGVFVTSARNIALYAQNAETISINIGGGGNNTTTVQPSPESNLVSGPEYVGLYPTPGTAWNNISGHWTGGSQTVTLTSAKAFDGETTTVRNTVQLSGTANNTYGVGTSYTSFLRGYLDDTGGVEVKIVGVPYSQYDVIIYATSDSSLQLNYFTINDVNYTCGSDGIATEGTTAWGAGQTTTPTFGENAMLVQGVTGSTLTISGTRAANSGPRVTVCAVQIINKGVVESSDWSANLDATTSFSGGNGAGLSGQSGTWVNNSLASIIITNKASDATLTLDGEITAGILKIVGDEDKCLSIAKDSGATLDITVYDLAESEEAVTFLFDPDFSKVNAGSSLIGVGYNYTGTIGAGFHYKGSENTLTLRDVNGGSVNIDGEGTISGDLGISGDATVTFSGDYTSSGNVLLGATKGVLNISEGSNVSVPHVRLVNSSSSVACTMNVDGALTVTSVSSGSNVYDERNSYKGILFGHYYGSSTVNVGATGSITGEAAWMQLTYTAPNTMTVNGGSVKVRGINGGTYSNANSPLTLTGGGVIEVADGFVNMGHITRNYGYGTVKTYSYNSSTGWTDSGAITFTDATNGTTIDTCGMYNVFTGALGGSGKVVISDSIGGGLVRFENASALSGDIVVESGVTLNIGTSRPTAEMTINGSLNVVLADRAEIPVLKVSAEPAEGSVFLYDTDGSTLVTGATVSYDAVSGTITISPGTPRWSSSTDTVFDTVANWENSGGTVPSGGTIIIQVSDDTDITVNNDYSYDFISFYGNGQVQFTGNGSISVSQISIASGVTAVMKGSEGFAANSITGEGSIVLNPGSEQSITLSADNSGFTGALTIESGTVKMGNKLCLGARNRAAAITVKNGAVLDLNGTSHGGESGTTYNIILEEGATYANSVTIGDTKMFDVSGLTLLGNATVDASQANIGVTRHYHNPTTINLGEYTLTKTGANDMFLSQPTISGSGTFRVAVGTVRIPRYYYGDANAQPSVSGTLEVDVGAAVQLETGYKSGVTNTVNNLVVNGEVKLDSAGEGAFRVTGSVSGTGTVSSPLVFAPGATFKPASSGYLLFANTLNLNNGVLTNDVSAIDFDSASIVPLFKVSSAELLPEASAMGYSCGELPKRWSLEKTSDGLGYRLKKFIPLTLHLR